QHLAAARVALVLGHDAQLGAQAAEDRVVARLAARAHVRPEAAARDQRGLHHLGVAGGGLLGGQRVKRVRVDDHGRRLVVRAHVVLRLRQIDAGLAAERRVHLGHERCRHLGVAHAALVHGRAEAGQVAHHAAAHCHHQVAARRARSRQLAQHLLGTWAWRMPRWYTAAQKPDRSPTTPPPTATTRSPRVAPARASSRSTCSARASVFSDSPAGISIVASPDTRWCAATFASVTTKRRASAGWKKPADTRPRPKNTGYSPEAADAHTRRAPGGEPRSAVT